MRVLHVIPSVATRYGGPSTAIVPMCRALSACGVEGLIATTDADGPGRLPVVIGERTSWQGVPAIFFGKAFSESFKYSPGLASWLAHEVRGFEIVHIHGVLSHACLSAAAACRRHGVPYLVRPLGTLVPWSLRQKRVRKRLILAVVGERLLEAAAAIHYTSAAERRSVESALALSNGVVVPLGVDSDSLEAPIVPYISRQREPYVLAISRIHPKKNLETLIHAFAAAARDRHERWLLEIAGDGDAQYVAALRRLAGDLGAADRIRFLGWVAGQHKRELLRHAGLFALCSKHENFGLAALEALAVGVPVLLSRQVDLADEVERGHAGWVVDGGTDALRDSLTTAFDNPEECEAKSRAARTLATRFAWPIVAAELTTLYQRVARGAHPGHIRVADGSSGRTRMLRGRRRWQPPLVAKSGTVMSVARLIAQGRNRTSLLARTVSSGETGILKRPARWPDCPGQALARDQRALRRRCPSHCREQVGPPVERSRRDHACLESRA